MKNTRILLAIVIAPTVLVGCSTTPAFNRHFGESAQLIVAQQTSDPEASVRNDGRAVDGVEGRAASKTMDRYYKSFAEPPKPANVFNIGLGTAGGAR